MDEESTETKIAEPPTGRKAPAFVALIAASAAIFTFFIYAYESIGRDFLDQVERRISDNLIAEARNLEAIGHIDEAIILYRNALSGSFSDRQVKFWCLRDLGRLLVSTKRTDEGIGYLSSARMINPHDTTTLNILCSAYQDAGKYELAEQVAREWLANQDLPQEPKSIACYHLGQIAELRKDDDAALAHYIMGVEISPTSINAFHAAVILERTGELQRARRILGEFFPTSTGWRREWAQKIIDRIDRALAS